MASQKNSQTTLITKKHFWKTLFEENDLARYVPELAIPGDDIDQVKRFSTSHYGEVFVKAKAASTLGDNFMSDTFIIEAILIETDTKFVGFIKVLPSNAIMREAAYESHAHHREINIYHDLFEFLRRLKGDVPIPLDTPELYYGIVEEKSNCGSDGSGTCIVIEDLREQGYRMANKFEGADDDHVRLALTSLAHYHALTVAALREWTDPESGELSKLPSSMNFILEKTFYDLNPADMMKEWIEMFVEFTDDINRPDLTLWINDILSRLTDVIVVDTLKTSGPLACILHGDFWNNNMLFRYEELMSADDSLPNGYGKPRPVAVKMVDFQISRIGNPLSDVLYFLYSSTTAELRKRFIAEWLKLYYDVLIDDLKLLGVHISDYTFESFMNDYRQRSVMWMLYGGMVMGMVLNKKVVDSLNDMDEDMQNQPENENDEEKEKGLSGLSVELEDKMKNMMKSNKLSENALVSDRLVKLFDEVKAIQNEC